MADPNIVHDWLTYFAALNVGGLHKDEVELRLAVLAPALAEEFPSEAFTPETARVTAKKHPRYFPTFGEICEVLQPFARAAREDRRLKIEYSALPAIESQEPYILPPAPEWCFDREPRLLGRLSREEVADLVQKPIRSRAQQYAELTGCSLAEAEAKLGIALVDA